MIGQNVSSYRITQKLGPGVYLAQDTELDRKAVVKFLPRNAESDPELVEQFVREAKTAARLQHPNIITVYKVGMHSGRPFAAMELVEGRSMTDILAGDGLAPVDALNVAIQICDGLSEAHKNGIFRRTINPDTILVGHGGRVRIANFASPALAHTLNVAAYTQSIQPPERSAGGAEDERSDVYSIGAILDAMDTDDQYKEIVARAMSEQPGDRHPSLEALATDLLDLRNRLFVKTPQTRVETRWLKPLSAAAFFAVVAALLLLLNPFDRRPTGDQQLDRQVIAVLPFENLGDTDDEYFADGTTDEIISRLAVMQDLGVISRTSSRVYKGTTKSIREIGEELNADFIIEGTIRWDKSRGKGRVRITPQLIRVADDTHVWANTYEREITEIFGVQADIATQIANALDVTLLDHERRALASRPTESIEAYQAYLKGMTEFDAPDFSRESFDLGAQQFERAIALDPGFAIAYARLSSMHSRIYHYGFDRSEQRQKMATTAVERAFSLQPELAEAHLALGYYHYWVHRDYDKALASMDAARELNPNSSEILQATAYVKRRQGNLDECADMLVKDLELSPLDASAAVALGETYGTLRRYADGERSLKHGIALAPDNVYPYTELALLYLRWRGDVAAARATLNRLPSTENTEACRAYFFVELFDREYAAALERLETCSNQLLEASTFFIPISLLEGIVLRSMNEPDRARSAFESARTMLESRLEQNPDDYRIHSALGIAYAGLERDQDAVRHGERAVELYPISRDALEAPVLIIDLALIYTMTGDHEAAIERLDQVLSIPSIISAPWLENDPRWDPLRQHPQFQSLLDKHRIEARL